MLAYLPAQRVRKLPGWLPGWLVDGGRAFKDPHCPWPNGGGGGGGCGSRSSGGNGDGGGLGCGAGSSGGSKSS